MDREAFITAEHLSFGYQNEEGKTLELALRELSVSIGEGELVAVLGHNGSGKSTLAKHFNAILLPQGGVCYVDRMDTREEDHLYDIRQRVGMVFQNPDNQIVATIVEEDVAFALENMGVPPAEIRQRVDEALGSVGMYEYREHAPHLLSGGQKQRVAIAGVIAMHPRCIVLDEPTAMLDPRGRREVMNTIRRLNTEEGVTVVLITHYMDEAAQCRRVLVVDKGQLLMDASPEEVFSHTGELKAVGLDVPQASELCHLLREDGYAIPGRIIGEEQCIEALSGLLDSRGIQRQ